ncbi:MAG: alpha/beta hydrolase [Xanthomonadaceae bacterium]|nr:alpha/beta hydrolase [Xanthomonadaceae bacterium]
MLSICLPTLRRLLALAVLTAAGCSLPPQQESLALAPQQPALLEHHAVMDDGYELPLQRWLPAAEPVAVVLALHGFNDYRNAFAGVGPYLASRGIVTYAYDQRGFGATVDRGYWPGTARMVADARNMIELLRAEHPDLPVYLLGESMGGAVSIATVAQEAVRELVDGVVLVAPAVWARQTMPWYQRWALAVARTVAPGWRPTGHSLKRQASDNIEMLRALGRDPLVIKKTRIDAVAGLADLMDTALASASRLRTRTLVLYGERDEIVPKLPTCRMLQTLPEGGDWKLALYPDGYHMLTRDLNGQRVIADIATWILDPQQPLPSGFQADHEDWLHRLCQQA